MSLVLIVLCCDGNANDGNDSFVNVTGICLCKVSGNDVDANGVNSDDAVIDDFNSACDGVGEFNR